MFAKIKVSQNSIIFTILTFSILLLFVLSTVAHGSGWLTSYQRATSQSRLATTAQSASPEVGRSALASRKMLTTTPTALLSTTLSTTLSTMSADTIAANDTIIASTAAIDAPNSQRVNLVENASFESGLKGWTVSRCTQDAEIAGLPEAACIFPIGPLRRSNESKVILAKVSKNSVSEQAASNESSDEANDITVAQLDTVDGSIRLRSSLMRVEPGSLVRFAVQAKAKKIIDSGSWHKGGMSLSVHDENGKKIRHHDFASFSGSFNWKKMNGELFIADTVHFVRLNFEIRQSSGTLWVDDVVMHAFTQPDFLAMEQAALERIEQTIEMTESAATDGKMPIVMSPDPALPTRGAIVAGSWFNSEEILKRFQKARFNFAWTQGSFLNQKMQYLWREPLRSNEKASIREWINRCEAQSVHCYLSLSPRGQSAAAGTVYSSQKEIDAVMKRFDALYELGVRNFGLSFDDLHRFDQAELLPEDAAEFEHMGQAHAYFVGEIYKQLTDQYDDIQLMIVPLYYDLIGNLGSNEEAYLYSLAELPQDIGMLSSVVFVEDAKTAIRLTGRRHVVWDNQFAFAYENGGAEDYIAPLRRPQLDESLIAGYAFLPLMKSREDGALISWQSASDYAWSPANYDATHSLERAIMNHISLKIR
mgnify:CR=1 FL=1